MFLKTYLCIFTFTGHYFLAFGDCEKHFVFSVLLYIQIVDSFTCFNGFGEYNLLMWWQGPLFVRQRATKKDGPGLRTRPCKMRRERA